MTLEPSQGSRTIPLSSRFSVESPDHTYHARNNIRSQTCGRPSSDVSDIWTSHSELGTLSRPQTLSTNNLRLSALANEWAKFRANWTVNSQTGEYNSTVPSPTGIPIDPPLAAHGVEQAKELAVHLCNIDPPIDVIYSSPFSRCLQTLKPATDRLFKEGKAGGKIRIEGGIGYVHHGSPLIQPPTVRSEVSIYRS